jgi:hypothetical protein
MCRLLYYIIIFVQGYPTEILAGRQSADAAVKLVCKCISKCHGIELLLV